MKEVGWSLSSPAANSLLTTNQSLTRPSRFLQPTPPSVSTTGLALVPKQAEAEGDDPLLVQ